MKFFFLTALVSTSIFAAAETNDFQKMEVPKQGISFYRPNYGIIGADPINEAEILFSYKFRFVDADSYDTWWGRPVNTLFFAYSQWMFWDFEQGSSPYPNNYMDSYFIPEFFWLWNDFFPESEGARLDLQFGYQHESNGRDEEFERTWDRLNVEPTWIWGETGDWQYVLGLKIWAPIHVGDQMNDISEYYGFGELKLKAGKHDGISTEVMLRKGTKDWNGAVEVTASYPIRPMNIFLYGQVFYGYGENLLRYDRETFAYRLGLAISR